MQLGQFSASVSVDGVQLANYAPEYSADGKEATCWIASESDKKFCVEWKNVKAKESCVILGYVAVDRIDCGGREMILSGNRVSRGSRDSVSTSETTRRDLVFAEQALTDDDAYLNTVISPHLGTIRLELWETRMAPVPIMQKPWTAPALEPQILHEQSKKVIGHSVQFGAEYQSHNNRYVGFQPEKTRHLVTFVFKYRPIGLLRAEGIAPPLARVGDKRPASPTDILDRTLVDENNDEEGVEIKQLEAREVKKKNAKRVKREPYDVKKEIKGEGSLFKPGEVIDLT
ncbi:hypothetical protein C8J57DRAFT_1198248 [Mycena rebaudengoi]|nr:hypothetical protein C8J57DRAFT_1198248 [Mycena rebaudengoi]